MTKENKSEVFVENNESKSLLEKLRKNGNRITQQRRDIVQGILNFSSPFSTEELFNSLKKKSVDLATIYRSLATFADLGILSKVDFSDGVLRYQYISDQGHHHHHIICTQCKLVEAVDLCLASNHEAKLKKMGYSQVSHKLEFFGVCNACA